MGSPSPAAPKVKRESPTTRAGPHRRTSSVTSSCVSLESGDQDVLSSPARSTGPGKSPVSTLGASSPRIPVGVNPGEIKSGSPAALKKRRSSIGGVDDLARGLDFSTNTSGSPGNEEKKLHSFLTKGGGHKKVAQPGSVIAQANSPGKKMGTTPPGKDKLVAAGRATSVSVLSPRKLADGREASKKDIMSSSRKSVSEGSSMNGSTASEVMGSNAEQLTAKKSSPLRASVDGKIGKSSPRLNTKPKSEPAPTKAPTNSNGEFTAVDQSSVEAEAKVTDYKFSPGASLDGKKSSPRTSLKSKSSSLTSSTGRRFTKNRQETPSPPQPGRVRTRVDKGVRNEELSRPEMESVEVPVYSEYEYEREATSEDVSHMMLVPLQHGEAGEERSTLLASLMAGGNVGEEDMSSLEPGGEPGTFDVNDMELPTSWLSEDLPCMFSSLSHLPEPDDSSSSLLGDPPELLDEPIFQGSSNAAPNDTISAVVSSPKSPVSTMDEKFVKDDTFEAELRAQTDATYGSPEFSVPQVEDPVDKFEDELRTQIDTAFESPQLSVPPVGSQGYVVPVDKKGSATMPYRFTTHPEDMSSSTSDNESTVSEVVANEAFLHSSQVAETMLTGHESQTQPISSQEMPTFKEDDEEEIFQLDPPSCAKSLISEPGEKPPLVVVEDEIPTSPEQLVVESSDDEGLEEVLEDSDSAQLNLKQSFDDVAEPHAVSRSGQVDETDISHDANTVRGVPVMVGPREDNALECQYAVGPPQELALPEFAPEFLDGQDSCGAFTPTSLDQDMKIFEEYWTHESVADESSQSDAGQNDAEDLQLSEPQLFNTVEDEAENSLPPVELPVSILPVVGKLKMTVEERPIDISDPPGDQAHGEVGATKIEILDVHKEILPTESLPCPDSSVSLPTSDSYQVGTELSAKQDEVEEFDEVFHLFGGSEELSKSAMLFDNLSSPSRPNESPKVQVFLSESFHETRFENAGESDSSATSPRYTSSNLETEHPYTVVGTTTQEVMGLQNRDVEGDVTEDQDFATVQDPSTLLHDPHQASMSVALEGAADQEPSHEDLGTAHILAVDSNDLIGVNIQYWDDDGASDDHSSIGYLHQGGPDIVPIEEPDLWLATDASHKSSFETPATSETHMTAVQSDDDLELAPENPSMLHEEQEFCAKRVQIAGARGDRNAALMSDDDESLMSDDCILKVNSYQSSPGCEFSSPIVQVAAETGDADDLGLEMISPQLPMVEDDETILASPQSSASAGAATEEVDPSDSNIAQFPPIDAISDEEQTEANFLSGLEKEEESFYGAVHSEGCERIENSIPGLEVQKDFDQEEHQGLLNSAEEVETVNGYSGCIPAGELLFSSTELEDNTQNISSPSREVILELPGPQDSGDDEFQDERVTTSALHESHEDDNESEVDHEPQILQFTHSQASETLENCSAEDENPTHVTTAALEKSLPIGILDESSTHEVLSAECFPVFNEEDDMITDKFDAKPEVISSASLDMVIPNTEATINSTDSTASSTEILGEDEAVHVVAAAPFVLSAEELPNRTPSEVGEFDGHESECEVNEEKPSNGDHSKLEIVDFEEQSKADQQDSEGTLQTVDSSGTKSSTEDKRDMLDEESIFTNASSSAVADARGDTTEELEIDQDKSEEASRIVSTSASTPSEHIEYHHPDLQETQLPLGASISSDDQVSPTEDAPEMEKPLITLSDAEDLSEAALDDHAINDVEIIPENCSSQDLPLKLLVTPSQDTPNADVGNMKEDPDLSWKSNDEEESLNGILEQNHLPKDVDTVVDSAEESFTVSDQDRAINVGVDERDEDPSFSPKTEREVFYLNGRLEEEPLLDDEETVVFNPKASGPDPKVLGANDVRNHSDISWTAGEDEESFSGSVKEEPLLEDEDTVVYSPEDTLDATISGANDIQSHSTAPWKADSEHEDNLNESLEDEDMAMESPKKSFLVSGQNVAISDVDDMEKLSNSLLTAGKGEESLNGSLERDSGLEDEKIAEPSLKDPLNVAEEETADTTILGVSDIQNHSNISWAADKDDSLESVNGSLEEEPLLDDEDTVVYRPMEPLVISGQDLPDTPPLVDEGHLQPSENAEKEDKSLNSIAMPEVEEAIPEATPEEEKVEEATPEVKATPEVQNAMPEEKVEHAMPEVECAMPKMEEARPEVQETVVDDHEEELDDKEEEESLNYGNILEKAEFMVEVQETVDQSPTEFHVAPDLLNANAEDLDVGEMAEHPTLRTDKEREALIRSPEENSKFEVEETEVDSPKESFPISDTIAPISHNVDELEQRLTWTTDTEGEALIRSPEENSKFEVEETEADSPKESFTISNTNAAISHNVDELEQHPTWTTDKEGEALIRSPEENSKFEVEETEVDSPKESFPISDTNAAMSHNVDELEHHSTRTTTDKEGEETFVNRNPEDQESMLESQETLMDDTSGNVKNVRVCEAPEVNGALHESINSENGNMGEDLVWNSKTEDSAVHIATDAVRAENPEAVNTDHVEEDSCDVIPEMTNGNHHHESDSPHETAAVVEAESTPQDVGDSLEEATEPESPEATLYPLLDSQPPFSGSQQDRLWEEQAEAYSSGGRGTPSRNEDATPATSAAAAAAAAAVPFHPPASPGEQPTSSDDQIQPASGPMNAVAGPSGENGSALQEPKGKGKLHTPLRSLLLEDASKSADGDSSTPNGATSSPSFIRRLFRVMSTPSRTADRDVSQTKHKKSSSMWVSCLGSPQVQQ